VVQPQIRIGLTIAFPLIIGRANANPTVAPWKRRPN
jgi:hypothetical protein